MSSASTHSLSVSPFWNVAWTVETTGDQVAPLSCVTCMAICPSVNDGVASIPKAYPVPEVSYAVTGSPKPERPGSTSMQCWFGQVNPSSFDA